MDETEVNGVAYFFYALGTVVLLAGVAWCALILGEPVGENHVRLMLMARALALLPGAGVLGTGLIFLAIGGMLRRLDRIANRNADTASAIAALASRIERQQPVLRTPGAVT